MFSTPQLSDKVNHYLSSRARALSTADPLGDIGGLIRRTFTGHEPQQFARNMLMPMAVPVEPSFSEDQPDNLRVTHKSLFDGSLQGIHRNDKNAFSFQGHPEASPGPHDAAPLFDHFIELMTARAEQS